MKAKTDKMSTKYGFVTIRVTESKWTDSGKKITVKVCDAKEEDASVIGMSRTLVAQKSEDLFLKRNQAVSRLREAVEERLKENYKQPSLKELFLSRISDEGDLSEWFCLCPPSWRQNRTKTANLGYFMRHVLIPISNAVEKGLYGPDVAKRVADEILADVCKNQLLRRVRNAERNEEDGVCPNDEATSMSNAKAGANQHIRDSNAILANLRDAMDYPDAIPYIALPLFEDALNIQPEQCKALELKTLIKTATLLRLSVAENPLSMGGILMMTSMLRTAEAVCPKFKEILILGNFGVYGVLWQSDGKIRIADLKTDSAYRLVIIPYFAVICLRKRREALRLQGYSDEEINEMYVVCSQDDPYRAARPGQLSAYLRKVLSLAGCSEDFWISAQKLMDVEPDPVPEYAKHPELMAYVLRRSASSYLCNCSGTDPRLVDVMMGHLLRRADFSFQGKIKDEDTWAKVADRMECIIYDPRYSANPAFSVNDTVPNDIHKRVQIRITEDMIKNGKVVLTIETARADDVLLTVPTDVTDNYTLTALISNQTRYPSINEILDQTLYDQCIETAQKIFDSNKEVFNCGKTN